MSDVNIDRNRTIAPAFFYPHRFGHLSKAHNHYERAQSEISDCRWAFAALDAYHAAYHAARAYIVTKTGKVSRTPRRIHAQFASLATLAQDVPLPLQRFVSFALRAVSLYEQDAVFDASSAEAADAVGKAGEFIELVTASTSTHKAAAKAIQS